MAKSSKPNRLEPPEHVSDEIAEVWRELLERETIAAHVDVVMLEAYCSLLAQYRAIAAKVAEEGLVVDGGERRGAVLHPALSAQRDLAEQIRRWGPTVAKPIPAARRAGPMVTATRKSIKASTVLADDDRFAGAVEGVLTYAWLIDEAQRAGIDALQKASFVLIPSYIKGCAELQITPASLPEGAQQKGNAGGKVSKFADAAEARRRRTAS